MTATVKQNLCHQILEKNIVCVYWYDSTVSVTNKTMFTS